MRILILGGTIFLGRHLVDAALRQGHQVTLFNRGIHYPDLYPEVESLRGSREKDLSALEGRTWDAVIDTSGYIPSIVRASAKLLAPAVQQYIFVSSLSVYADNSVMGQDETGPVETLTPEQIQEAEEIPFRPGGITAQAIGPMYGGLKALCEQAAEEGMPGRVMVVRPGLIVGPYDPSDRFTYWVRRVAQGGEILAPGLPERQIQFIDGRDLAEWILHAAEHNLTGTFNATGPHDPLTMGQLLQECQQVSQSDAHFTWIDDAFVLQEEISPWIQLPLWLPDEADNRGFFAVSTQKARAAGLTFRSPSQTVKDTLAWDASRSQQEPLRAGITSEQEQRVLQKWHQQHT